MIIKIISFLSIFIILFNEFQAQDVSGEFNFDGKRRKYDIYLPQELYSNMPVVLNLHGYGWNTKDHADYTKMHEYADTLGFLVVYPFGSVASNAVSGWNNGLRDHPFGQTDTTSNDIGFISALIDTLSANYSIDLGRIYCCGFSMGGEMTYRLAIELGYRFAAIASIAGKLNDVSVNSGVPVRAFPVLHFHGTNDIVETYNGFGDGNLWSVDEIKDYWMELNNCETTGDTTFLPDVDENDGCTVEKMSFLNCTSDSKFILHKIVNGGHSWPGSKDIGSPSWEGNKNMDINASKEMLMFFKNYQNPLVDLAYGRSVNVKTNFLDPNSDTLLITAELINPANHASKVFAIIESNQIEQKDSIELFDDGMHEDGNESDNIFSNSLIFDKSDEYFYQIKLKTTDLNESITTYCRKTDHFTTVGPVIWKGYKIEKYSDSLYSMKVTLENQSSSMTIKDISALLSTSDTNITEILRGYNPQDFTDIEPGKSVENTGTNNFYVFYTKNNPETVRFVLKIYSENIMYWTDTSIVDLVTDLKDKLTNPPDEFALLQNYPNPFNPMTRIKYCIPVGVKSVLLKIYDVLSREVVTLVNEEQKAGYYEVTWDAAKFPSGVYFYKLRSGEYTQTRKMLLIK